MTFESAFQSALRTQGDISDDEIKRAEFVARSVAVAMLHEAWDAVGNLAVNNDSEMAMYEKSHYVIRAIIRQVRGKGNGHSNY